MPKKKVDRERILTYVSGALYFYGVMDFEGLFSAAAENLPKALDRDTFKAVLDEEAMRKDSSYGFRYDKGLYIYKEVENPELVIAERNKRPEIPFRPVTEKEARLAAEKQYTSLWKEPVKKLYQQMQEKHNWLQDSAHDMIIYSQHLHRNNVPGAKLLEEFLGEMEFNELDEVQPFIDMVMDMTNNTPLWILKGWTPGEVFEKHEKENLQPLPDKPFDVEWVEKKEKASFKVGRNEPCPCESGKKFKKCCGDLAAANNESSTVIHVKQAVDPPKEPTLEEWRALYEAAQAFKEAQCWEWMYNDDLFGVKDPETGEIAYCCIMGCTGEMFGLGAYLGTEGLSGILNMMSEPEEDYMNLLITQKCLMATFEDRGILEDSDRAVIKELGLKFRGKKNWPMFRSYEPGYFPWYINAWECRFLTLVLQQALEVSLRCRKSKEILERGGEDGFLIRVPRNQEGELKWFDHYFEPAVPEKRYWIEEVQDELLLKRAFGSKKQVEGIWEADIFWLPFPIQEKKNERPYFMKAFVILDSSSGLIVCHELIKNVYEEGQKCIKALLQLIIDNKWAPSEIVVEQEETYYLLMKVCRQLQIPLELVEELHLMPEIREEIIEGDPEKPF